MYTKNNNYLFLKKYYYFVDVEQAVSSKRVLPPVNTILDPSNFDTLVGTHNGIGCQLVSQDLFDICLQPIMSHEKLSSSEFDKLFASVSPNQDNSDVKKPQKKPPSLENAEIHVTRSTKTDETEASNNQQNISKSIVSTTVAKYKCTFSEDCGQTFKTKSLLGLHIDVHRGVRHLCPEPMCDKTFAKQVRLRNHVEQKQKKKKVDPVIAEDETKDDSSQLSGTHSEDGEKKKV